MGDGVERFITQGDQPKDDGGLLDEWLEQVEMERQVVIMRLRHYDAILVRHGRLRAHTLPRRNG